MVSASGRRLQVAYAVSRGIPVRRACLVFRTSRTWLQYESKIAVKDAKPRKRMRALAARYSRYGYRRIRVFLAREGLHMGRERAHRLWRAEGLQIPRKKPRRRMATSTPRPTAPSGEKRVWAYDFVFDNCTNGQKLKCLTVIDEWTREALAIEVAGSIRSSHIIDTLARLVRIHGAPAYLRSDNGPEFVATSVTEWVKNAGFQTTRSDPGKPWQNGTDESFNGRLRDECLNIESFRSRREAISVIEAWRIHYNTVRPHSSLDYLTPAEFKRKEKLRQVHQLETIL